MYLVIFGHPRKSPTIDELSYIAAGHRYFDSRTKNDTPVTGTGSTRTIWSAIMSLKLQWIQPRTGLAEPT